ncbi:large proline-rich protein BAG6-like [Dendronephthya gigantea]|uniref:large proline-rich protein BAG6-like n=1 Tax=Dendronephthya gigantea TaxID=151771 RepID=UPI00106AC970|nr:large proline-rich protein BAG6-like [Dendronephthya gigantea]
MKIPVEKQRLIFQGKVLQDEKLLTEYKVDGCVVHLVERQPPRTTRLNEQSTETTTSSTATTSSPGNMFMGAFAMPVDVMGVTQQIVQGIIQQIGAESAQANISTSSSDDGSSVNVHINLSTVMARNNARSRIAPARDHLNKVSRIIHRLQNDGLPSGGDLNEETPNSERQPENSETGNNNENLLGDLADVLQQVVRLNDEFRPHLERYQELLRSGQERELRPVDDLLPDLTAEALHSLSHAYHALSDVTTNFRAPETRLNVLPSMSPIPASVAHLRNTSLASNQSRPTTTSTSQTSTSTPTSLPIGIGLRPGLGTGIGLRTGRGLGPSFNLGSGVALRPGNGIGTSFGARPGIPIGISRLIPGATGVFPSSTTGSPVASVPPTTSVPTTSTGSIPGQQTPQQNPPDGLPINLRNLPNFAVQFNPGNITIAHIVTTVVEEPTLRTTTTTTNSTPSPRTSSWGSDPPPDNQTTPQTVTPMDSQPSTQSGNTVATSASQSNLSNGSPTQSTNTTQPSTLPNGSHSNGQNSTSGQIPNAPRQTNAVVNFMPQNAAHRDPLLPCQSFHFASLVPRRGQSAPVPAQSPEAGDRSSAAPGVSQGNGIGPGMLDLTHLMNVSQQRAAEQLSTAAMNPSQNAEERNSFLDLFLPREAADSSNAADEVMLHMAGTVDEGQISNQGTLSRYVSRLLQTIPLSQLLVTVIPGSGDPWAISRPMTRDFLRDDILRGGEATPENLQRATERILDELQGAFESSFASCNVKDNIDAPETLLSYLRPKIRRILEIVNSSEPDSIYVAEISGLVSRTAAELVLLIEYCLQDGTTGMENAFRRSLNSSPTIASLDQNIRRMTVDAMWAYVYDLRNEIPVRISSLMPFVVRKEKRKSAEKKVDSSSPKINRKEEKKVENSHSSTAPRISAGNTPSSSRRTRGSSQPDDIPMETDENWKKVIPAEWVPVISQDIIRQQRMPRQAPFSDAYLNGMPPKRRKIHQGSEPVPYNQCVSGTLKRSIRKAGVTPKTDLEKLNEEASNSQSLEQVFEEEVKSEVRKRLATDSDYNSEKFPSIHQYFEEDEKR